MKYEYKIVSGACRYDFPFNPTLCNKKSGFLNFRKPPVLCGGGRIRTSDLRVMSPTSYQLLYPAM